MDTRESTETIEFRRPFALRSARGTQPAGRYIVQLEERTIDGLSFPAWMCAHMTIMHDTANGLRQALPITPGELAELRCADGQGAP
jgi:hypothetical protein